MAIRYQGDVAVFEQQCAVEEAADLAEWLLADRSRRIDLAACTGLHSALVQTLMALAPPMLAPPGDAALARWLGPVLPPAPVEPVAEPAQATAPKTRTTSRTRRSRKADVQ